MLQGALRFPYHVSCSEILSSGSHHFQSQMPTSLRTPKAPRYIHGKTNQEATPHMNFWFCSQSCPPPLPPLTLRKPDVQIVNRGEKKKSHPDHLKRGQSGWDSSPLSYCSMPAIYSLWVPSPASRSLIVAQPRANPHTSSPAQGTRSKPSFVQPRKNSLE